MNVQFPPIFNSHWKQPGIKAAFVTESHPHHPGECINCGGIGTMTTFCATAGPFDNPPVGKLIAHFGNGKWWGGANFSASCPVCNGTGRRPGYNPGPTRANPIKAKAEMDKLKPMNTGQTESLDD